MRCPHCGTELEKGTIFCPKCLEEIHWVPEYNTIETIITKDKVKKIEKQFKKKEKRPKKKHTALWVLLILIFIAIIGAGGWYAYLQYQHANSFSYQLDRAKSLYNEKKYEEAMDYCDRAIVLKSDSIPANVLYAQIMEGMNNYDSAIAILNTFIKDYPDADDAYGEILSIYDTKKDMDAIKALMKNCSSEKIRTHYAAYICEDPQISVNTGTYTAVQKVEITCPDGKIFYTLDGTEATTQSTPYESAISIGEGVTQLNVIAVNEKGITSDNIYKKYIVSVSGPSAPVVTPEAGTYTSEDNIITVEVPEGCLAYYAFDVIPTPSSTQYLTPVNMPEGTHTFYAILVGANGKSSEPTSRSYTFNF